MADTKVGIRLAVEGADQVRGSLAGVEQGLDRLNSGLAKVGHYGTALLALPTVFNGTVGSAVKAADAVTTLNNQLRLATGSTQAAGQAYSALFDIAQRSRVSFTELGGTFAAISRAGQELGVSQARLLTVTEAIGNAMTVSGGSAQGMQAALTQLGQGLASGTLRGEELNSVMEQTPRLAKALADGLGVSTGKLREMGAAGQITAEQVIKALEGQAAVLRGEVQGAVLSVGQAYVQLENATVKAVGEFDKASGASSTLAQAMSGLAGGIESAGKAFSNNEAAIKTTLGLLAGAGVAAGLARTATALGGVATGVGGVAGAVAALKVVVSGLNPATLALMGIGTVIGAAAGYESYFKGTQEGIRKTIADLEEANVKAGESLARMQARPEITTAINKAIADRTSQIQKLRAELGALDSKKAPAGSVGSGDTALARAQVAENTRLAASYDDLRTRLSGFKGDFAKYQADLTTIQELQAKGYISEKEAVARLTELALKHGEVAKAAKGSESEAKKAADAELAWRRRYTLDLIKGWDDEAEAREKAYASARAGALKLADANEAAQAASTAGLIDKLDAMRNEIDLLGLSTAAQAELTAVKAEQVIADKEIQLIMLQNADASAVQIQLLEQEIALRKQLVAAMREKAGKEAAVDAGKEATKAADKAQEAWQKASQQIEQSLTDALMRGFESGKDFARNLRDTLVNMFKTLVLRPVISAVVNPVAGAITGSLGLTGAANAGTSALSSIGSLASFSSAFGAGGAAGFGALIGGGFTEAVSAGFTTLLTGGSVGTAAAGLGTLAGALGPIALGLGALSALIGSTGGESRWGGQYGYNFGDGLVNNRRGTEVENATLGVNRLEGANTLAEAQVQGAIQGTVQSINNLLKAAGSSAALVGFQAGLETSGKGRGGVFAGGTLSNGVAFGESGAGDNYAGTLFEKTSTQSPDAETALKNFALDLQQATVQALQAATDVPEAIKALVQDVDAEGLTAEAAAALLQTIDAQVTGVNQLRAAFDAMGLEQLATIGFDAAAALATAAGGFEALGTSLSSYYQTYYTEAERTANTATQLASTFADLGLAVPATKDAFRSLVEAQDLTTEAGRNTYTALLQVAPAFANVADAASAAADQMQDAWASILATRDQSAADAFNVDRLFQQYKATDKYGIGNASDFLTISQEDFAANYTAEQQQIISQIIRELSKGVTSAATPATPTPYGNTGTDTPVVDTTVADLAQQITDALLEARANLGVELLRAQGKDAEAAAALRAIETEGYNAAQLALYDYNQTLRDQIDALTEAKRVADERKGLEQQYLQLTGATTALRAMELEKLDASNRALQERIWALQDARQNTDAAYAALERAVAAQRKVLDTQRNAAQTLVSEVQGVFDTLKTNVRDLFGTVESAAKFQAQQGRAFITQALAGARAGTGLPDGADLSEAISAARSGLDAQVYASQAEADFQRLVLANELKDLQDIGGVQLTIAEQQLEAAEDALAALDDTLQAAKDQIDELRGINTSVLSVADAVAELAKAVLAEKAVTPTRPGANPAPGANPYPTVGAIPGANVNEQLVNSTFQQWFGRAPKEAGLEYWANSGLQGQALVDSIIAAGKANGENIYPRFAAGGFHMGGLRLVGENGPELEATGPSRIWNAQQMQQALTGSSGNERLERLVEGLTAEVQRLQSIVNDGNVYQRRTAETLDNVTEGGSAMRSQAVA